MLRKTENLYTEMVMLYKMENVYHPFERQIQNAKDKTDTINLE